MKKILTIVLLALAVFACSRKTVTTTARTGTTTTEATSEVAEIALTDSRPMSDVPVKTDPSTAPVEALAAGKAVYNTRCGTCHELNPVENFTAQRWEGILKNMIPKARLNETDAAHVTAYVKANAKK